MERSIKSSNLRNMKKIENKSTTIPKEGTNEFMTFFDLIEVLLNTPSVEGFSLDKMRQYLSIMDAIDKSDKVSVEIKLNEFTSLKEVLNKFKWGQSHKDIVVFADYINSL
jgi:hypothetical protein